MTRATVLLPLFAAVCAFARPEPGIGVFVNGEEIPYRDVGLSPQTGVSYSASQDMFFIHPADADTTLVLSGRNVKDNISFMVIAPATIRFENLDLRTSATNRSPFIVEDGAIVTLVLSGANRLEAGPGAAGLRMLDRCRLTITNAPGEEAASLVAVGGSGGAGIGTDTAPEEPYSLSLCGGIVDARGGAGAAGIGKGTVGRLDELNVNGGTAWARGDGSALDFSSGFYEETGHQFIRGGSFDVTRFGFQPSGANYRAVYPVVIHDGDWQAGDPVSVSIESSVPGFSYATNGIFAGPDGAIHLWLPNGTHALTVDGVHVEAVLDYFTTALDIDISNSEIAFADWCARFGLEPREDAVTEGEPNILRYVFGKHCGPLPMPTLDPEPKYPTAVMPPRKHEHPKVDLKLLGTTDLSLPVTKWKVFNEASRETDRWVWSGPGYPASLFVRYLILY